MKEQILPALKILWFVVLNMCVIAITATAYAATITVNAPDEAINNDGNCSISEAIHNANDDAQTYTDCVAGSGTDTIELNTNIILSESVDATDGSNGTPSITSIVIIDGQGYGLIRDDALTCNADGTIDPDEFRLMHIASGGNLTLENIRLANGCADGHNLAVYGGAILNRGTVTVNSSFFDSNMATNDGGAISNTGTIPSIVNSTFTGNYSLRGGGVNNLGIITTISNSTFSDNLADIGGGIYNKGTLTKLSNSTFSSNSASRGGGIADYGTDSKISNCTFSGNSATTQASGLWIAYTTLGTLENTIFTNSIAGTDCVTTSGTISTANNNYSDGSCHGYIGTVTNFEDSLEDNGCTISGPNGCVKTHALLAGSNAIDKAENGTNNDQRGFAIYNLRDIGAFERQQHEILDCPTALTVDGFTTTVSTAGALLQAIHCANTNGDVNADEIKLGANIVLTGDDPIAPTGIFNDSIAGRSGTPTIISNIVLNGNNHTLQRKTSLTCYLNKIEEQGEFRLLHVAWKGILSTQSITLENGCADGSGAS